MTTDLRALLLGALLALWFPVALAVTHASSSEPGEIGTPTRVPALTPAGSG